VFQAQVQARQLALQQLQQLQRRKVVVLQRRHHIGVSSSRTSIVPTFVASSSVPPRPVLSSSSTRHTGPTTQSLIPSAPLPLSSTQNGTKKRHHAPSAHEMDLVDSKNIEHSNSDKAIPQTKRARTSLTTSSVSTTVSAPPPPTTPVVAAASDELLIYQTTNVTKQV
jgi:hypothetical protein